jgi:hypothetical protein
MSCKLIASKDWLHDFTDDLESSIYVILWVMLMYSTCSDRHQAVVFLDGVLDPQPQPDASGGFTKADFLLAGSFLVAVKFPGRPNLDKLLDQLTVLFSCRYEKSSTKANGQPDPLERTTDPVAIKSRMEMLKNHLATIALFDAALKDRSKWLTDDGAFNQGIRLRAFPSSVLIPMNTSLVNQDMSV